ncbi:MAG: ATP-binding cassette domain-containing protein [Candidatus Omnitrophica bacterium]|nr:ATP-binding cassette domain-containing protein [Candidatus Omnitrophota bacterium]
MPPEDLLQLDGVEHSYQLPSGKTVTALSDIHLTLRSGELVALLGPSGCGKSTLIRIAAGLIRPTKGEALYRHQPMRGPHPNIALIFQQFALYPWLTVTQNIEQALIARGIQTPQRRQRIAEVIALIGLEGFEEAYPREISGGMKQRVGIARALAVSPELLCMDEPFSQTDALTSETLRNEVLNLWRDRERYPESILLVSHDIHEVALMANRILVMSANPGRIQTTLENALPYPRDTRSAAYAALVERLHDIITGLYMPESVAVTLPQPAAAPTTTAVTELRAMTAIPLVEIREIVGLLEAIKRRGDDVEFFRLTTELGLTFTRILLAAKAAELLGFLETPQDRLVLTELGRHLLASPRKGRKQIVRKQLLALPIIKRLRDMLEHSEDHTIPKDVILEELAIQCPQEDPKRLFRILMNWGRFADVWTFIAPAGILTMNGANRPVAAKTPSEEQGGNTHAGGSGGTV